MTHLVNRGRFVWRGLALHVGRRKKPVLTLVADPTYPHLYRIKYPNGWTSTPANLTRAHDAAYGHARHLHVSETGQEAPQSRETDVGGGGHHRDLLCLGGLRDNVI